LVQDALSEKVPTSPVNHDLYPVTDNFWFGF